MNTIKNIFRAYRVNIILALLMGQFMNVLDIVLALKSAQDMPDPELIYPANCYIHYFIIVMSACLAVRELASINNHLLPATTLSKYLTAIGAAFTFIVCNLLLCYLIDGIGEGAAQAFSLRNHINIGGYINYLFERTGWFSCMILTIGVNVLLATLIRNKNAMQGAVITISMISSFYAIVPQVHYPIQCITFWTLGIILLIASYHIYKRWEPANNKYFMI